MAFYKFSISHSIVGILLQYNWYMAIFTYGIKKLGHRTRCSRNYKRVFYQHLNVLHFIFLLTNFYLEMRLYHGTFNCSQYCSITLYQIACVSIKQLIRLRSKILSLGSDVPLSKDTSQHLFLL